MSLSTDNKCSSIKSTNVVISITVDNNERSADALIM